MNESLLSAELLPKIEHRLQSFLESKLRNGIALTSEMSLYHFATGGKRLRAMIPVWVYEACGASLEQQVEEAVPLGCALELVHNATLVHDDLQDGDRLRRGQPTVWRRWSPAQAINCGDALFQLALDMACEVRVDPAVQVCLVRRLTQGTLEVIEGQAQEFLMKDEPFPTFERYLGVIEGKTAALFATAFGSALIALGVGARELVLAEDAALTAGLIFQLQDDLLDLYGEKRRDRRGSDIAEGKISSLIALLNERAGREERARVAAVLRLPRDETSDAHIAEVSDILEAHHVRSVALQRIRELEGRLEVHELRESEPRLHRLLLELAAVFLEPIRSI